MTRSQKTAQAWTFRSQLLIDLIPRAIDWARNVMAYDGLRDSKANDLALKNARSAHTQALAALAQANPDVDAIDGYLRQALAALEGIPRLTCFSNSMTVERDLLAGREHALYGWEALRESLQANVQALGTTYELSPFTLHPQTLYRFVPIHLAD